jgi:hypothetical protein
LTIQGVYAIWLVQFSQDAVTWYDHRAVGAPLVYIGRWPLLGQDYVIWGHIGGWRYWRLFKMTEATAGGYYSEVQFFEQ